MIALARLQPATPTRRTSTTTITAPRPPHVDVGALRPCPFCGAAPVLEPDPWLGECVRIACGSDACRVAPKTEYLLVRHADELREAWNGRSDEAEPAS
jgi:hypothetical protein